jgi:hypothetical protein
MRVRSLDYPDMESEADDKERGSGRSDGEGFQNVDDAHGYSSSAQIRHQPTQRFPTRPH